MTIASQQCSNAMEVCLGKCMIFNWTNVLTATLVHRFDMYVKGRKVPCLFILSVLFDKAMHFHLA